MQSRFVIVFVYQDIHTGKVGTHPPIKIGEVFVVEYRLDTLILQSSLMRLAWKASLHVVNRTVLITRFY